MLGTYLSAVLQHWEFFAFGVGGPLMVAYNHYCAKKTGQSIPVWFIWSWIGICLFAATYFAWKAEREDLNGARSEIRDLSLPQMAMTLDQIVIANAVRDRKPITSIHLIASITNTGAQSICKDWKLTVKGPDVSIERLFIWVGMARFEYRNSGQIMVLDTDQQLFKKTYPTPVTRNGGATGFIYFDVPGHIKDRLADPRMVYTLSCRDIRGDSVVGARPWRDDDSESPRMLPGLDFTVEQRSN